MLCVCVPLGMAPLRGARLRRFDDLESLAYSILAVCRGAEAPLPWKRCASDVHASNGAAQGAFLQQLIRAKRDRVVIPGRFASMTTALQRFVELTRKEHVDMSSSAAPDYDALRTLFPVN